jgi:hypothetical protein
MQPPEGFSLDDPTNFCAWLQFKATRFGWDLIRVSSAVEKAQVARAIASYKVLLNPGNTEIAAAKFINDESLYKRMYAQRVLQECVERTNYTVEQLDAHCDYKLIEQSRDAYHALMSTVEVHFDATLAREAASLMPVLYWLDSETDVDELCNTILDINGVTPREQTLLAMLNSTDPHPIEVALKQ